MRAYTAAPNGVLPVELSECGFKTTKHRPSLWAQSKKPNSMSALVTPPTPGITAPPAVPTPATVVPSADIDHHHRQRRQQLSV